MDEKVPVSTELQMVPQNMRSLFDNVIDRWKDDGPVQGHIKALEKNKPRQQLFLKKDQLDGNGLTRYFLDIIDESTHLKKQVELAVTPNGTEKATYRVFSEHTRDPIEIELTEEDRGKLEHDLITRSRWGTEKTFNPFGYLDVSQIPEESLLQQLGLDSLEMPKQVVESARKSQWYSIDNGRIILEVRNPNILKSSRSGSLQLSDFDDTIFGSNNQHKDEYQLLENDPKLNSRGIHITTKRAEDIYQLSKILVPGFADKEPRYTPRLNLVLLTMYANALKTMPETEAFAQISRELKKIDALINKENYIASYAIDPDILNIYKSTDLGKFLYRDFAEDFLTGTEPQDMRVIVTRGKIGGLLGQIQKNSSMRNF